MNKSWFPVLISAFLLGLTRGEEPVYFADANLKAAVEETLWVTDPTPTDMLGLTTLYCTLSWSNRGNGLTDLTGLEYATNLGTLHLRLNQISDISALSGLSNLQTLDISQNCISNLSPLSGLDKLTYLNLHGNQISDISPLSALNNLEVVSVRLNRVTDITALSGMTSLRDLDLGLNQISDVSPLSALGKLSKLCLWCNQIRDISPLSGATNLEVLDLSGNRISDISPLSSLSNLSNLCLESNAISDISPLSALTSLSRLDLQHNQLNEEAYEIHIPQIIANNPGISISHDPRPRRLLSISSTAGGSIIDPGEGEFSYDYDVFVRIEAEAEAGFVFAGWSGTYSTTVNPTFLIMDRDYEMQANFVSVLETLHVDDDAPNDPGPGDPNDGDPNENGTTEHPYDRIQEAIDVAADGATVVVHPGTYHESINLLGKSIHLTGVEPNGAPWPVIDGGDTGPLVSFVRGEDPNCMLTGFVLTAGKGEAAGAIMCSQSSPTVANCLIVGNRATEPQGAAVYCKNSGAVFDNCTLADNVAGEQGAGLMLVDSDVVLSNSIVWGNTPNQIVLSGDSIPSIIYSDISGGWLDLGNIEADPLFAQRGQWVTSADPNELLWTTGDYHLQSQTGRWDPKTQVWVQDNVTSPCVDAGDPAAPVGAEPAPNGGIVNMGAYGGTIEASLGR